MLYDNEDQYEDAREYYEGSDLDNWETEQVFQDHEDYNDEADFRDGYDEADMYDPGEYDPSDEEDMYGGWQDDDGRWDE